MTATARAACVALLVVGCRETTVTPTKTTTTATATATATAAPTATGTATATEPETAAPEESSEPLSEDARAIQKIVRGNFRSLRRCYEAGLTRDPNLAGRVKIVFTIRPDGSVEKIATATRPLISTRSENVQGAMPDREVMRCIGDVFATLKFAKRAKAASITYPILFSPG